MFIVVGHTTTRSPLPIYVALAVTMSTRRPRSSSSASAARAGFNFFLRNLTPIPDAAPAFPASAPESDTARLGCADGRETPDATMNSHAHDAPAGHAEAQAGRAVSLSKQAPPKVTQPVPAVPGATNPQPLSECR